MPWQGWRHKLNRGESISICVKESYWVRFSPDHSINGLGEVRRITPIPQRGIVAGVQMTPVFGQCKKESLGVLYYRLRFSGKMEVHSLSDLVYRYIGFRPWVSWGFYLWIRERAKRRNAIVYEKSKSPQRKAGLAKLSRLSRSKTIQIPYKMASEVTPEEARQGALRMNFKPIPSIPEYAISETGLVKRVENSPRANKDWRGFMRQPSKINKGNPHYIFTVGKNPIRVKNMNVKLLVAETHGNDVAKSQVFNRTWTDETRAFVAEHNKKLKEKHLKDKTGDKVTRQAGQKKYTRHCANKKCNAEFSTNIEHQRYCCTKCRKRDYVRKNPPRPKRDQQPQENQWGRDAKIKEASRVHVSDPFGESIPNNPDMCPLG